MWRMALSNSTLHFQFILKLLSKACRVANVSPEKLFELLGRSCQTLSNVVEDCISSSKNWDLCCRGVPQKITLFPREDKRENDRSIYHRTWKALLTSRIDILMCTWRTARNDTVDGQDPASFWDVWNPRITGYLLHQLVQDLFHQ